MLGPQEAQPTLLEHNSGMKQQRPLLLPHPPPPPPLTPLPRDGTALCFCYPFIRFGAQIYYVDLDKESVESVTLKCEIIVFLELSLLHMA